MMADLRGFILDECFIGYDFVRTCLRVPGTATRRPGLMGGDSNLIFAFDYIIRRKRFPVLSGCKGNPHPLSIFEIRKGRALLVSTR